MTDFPEAGAVVNVDYKRTDGFVVKLTLRDATGAEVLKRLEGAIAVIKKDGGVPYERSYGKQPVAKEYIEGRVCPVDGGKLVKPSKPNQPIKCDNGRYDFPTKTTIGCQYIEWSNQNQA
jgi:hypothetical protein